jgi:hypothetical protein
MIYAIGLLIVAAMETMGVLLTVNKVGKPRKTVTPAEAAWTVSIGAAAVVFVVISALHLL